MPGKNLLVSVLVNLVDRVTGPLNRLMSRFGQFGRSVGLVGSALAAISFAAPIAQAAQWDQSLRNLAVTAGLSGMAVNRMIENTSLNYQRLALDVGVFSSDIAAGANTLIAAGLDPDRVNALLPVVARVTKASHASLDDIARTSLALSDTLRVPTSQMEQALAGLVVAGKAGRFELADMAKYFPALSSQIAQLGVKGTEATATLAAGLQIAMKGAADPSQAANNMQNFLAALNKPEVIKNFEKFGVDISGVMTDAVSKGINPVEAVLQKITKITRISQADVAKSFATAKLAGLSDAGALAQVEEQVRKIGGAARLGRLFGDQQAMSFLLPMLANIDEFKSIADQVRSADVGVITADAATQAAGLSSQLDRLTESATQLGRRVGAAFGANLGWITGALDMLMQGIASIDQMFPGAIDMVLTITGTLAALVVGLGVLAPALGIVSAGFGALAAVVAAVTLPLIAVAAVIGGAALVIMTDWKRFEPFFRRLWTGVLDTFKGAARFLKSLFSGDFTGMLRGLRQMLGGFKSAHIAAFGIMKNLAISIWNRIKHNNWIKLGRDIVERIVGGLTWFKEMGLQWGGWLKDRILEFDYAKLGKDIVTAMWDGMKSIGGEISAWFSSLFTLPDWVKNLGVGTQAAPAAPGESSGMKGGATGGGGGGGGGGGWKDGALKAPAKPAAAQFAGTLTVKTDRGTRVGFAGNPGGVNVVTDRGLVIGRV